DAVNGENRSFLERRCIEGGSRVAEMVLGIKYRAVKAERTQPACDAEAVLDQSRILRCKVGRRARHVLSGDLKRALELARRLFVEGHTVEIAGRHAAFRQA